MPIAFRSLARLIFIFSILGAVPKALCQSAVVGQNAIDSKNAIIGFNSPMSKLTAAQQNERLDVLKAAGVHFIRAGITEDEKGLAFAGRARDHGIKILWLVAIKYRPDAPTFPYPNRFGPNVWGGHPLSSADPEQFRSYFEPLLAKLEGKGITLAGFELGNEINSGCFNSDFAFSPPATGQASLFGLDDLYHNPSAQPAVKGYRQYLKLLAVLKDVRDHSHLNQNTPIISAGLVCAEELPGPRPKNQLDAVSASAWIEYMRAGGLDKLVDAYGLHTYPQGNAPGNPDAVRERKEKLAKFVLMQCHSEGSKSGKPGWITEWGFQNNDTSCPPKESKQVALVHELMSDFRPYVEKRKLLGLFYYTWAGDNGDHYGVYRCNQLTETGRSALAGF